MSETANQASATIELPSYFSDHMVLQQGVVTRVLGHFEPGAKARLILERLPADGRPILAQDSQYGIIFDDLDKTDAEGFFDFRLPKLAASFDPYRLTLLLADQKKVISDILVGEVWIAGGAANMAMPLSAAVSAEQIETLANAEHVRVFKVPENGLFEDVQTYSYDPLGETSGSWKPADSTEAVADVSAIGAAFARSLHIALDVPIGLVDVACSGTYIHSWLPRERIEGDTFVKGRAREVKQYRDRDNWNRLTPDKRQAEDGEQAVLRPQVRMRRPMIVGDALFERQFDPKNQPAAMFNHKLAPFIGLGMRGMLWYPGENEVDAPDAWVRAFRHLTETADKMFTTPDNGPCFLYAQVPPGDFGRADFRQLAVFNEAIAQLKHQLRLPAGCITVYDLDLAYGGDNGIVWDIPYRPRDKYRVGERFKQIALGLAYGRDLPPSAPEPKLMEQVGNKLLLDFDHVGAPGQGLRIRDDGPLLKGFAVCGPDRVFVEASARILHGVRLIVWHDEIDDPQSLTYAFSNFNDEANLVSAENIPVTPFRIDRVVSEYYKPIPWSDCDRLERFVWPRHAEDLRRVRREDWPAVFPLWDVDTGRGELSLTREQTRWGRHSICLQYKNADSRAIVFGPRLHYASLYPPLDLSMWQTISFSIFSTDHAGKTLALSLEDENGVRFAFEPLPLAATYSWQKISFQLGDAAVNCGRLTKISLTLSDQSGRGTILLDRVAFSGLISREFRKEK